MHGPGEPLGQAQGEPLVAAGHPEGLAGREAGPGVAEDGRGQLPDRLAGRDLEPGGDRLPGARVEGQLGQHGRHRTAAGPNWEVYGHWLAAWNDDPSQIRTDVFYLLRS